MATTLAETYYLKALESYPWELSEVIENLSYALSYDDCNAAANCLMGQLQANYLMNFSEAEHYYEQAIMANPEFSCAYEHLIMLYIHQRRLAKAQKVLDYAQSISTISRSFVLLAMAQILERKGQLKLARRYLKAALAEALSNEEQEHLQAELKRLKAKAIARKKL